jgi:hypothetical protein
MAKGKRNTARNLLKYDGAADEAAEQLEQLSAFAAKEIAQMPSSISEYRRRMLYGVELFIADLIRPTLAGDFGGEFYPLQEMMFGHRLIGYRLDSDALRDFDDAVAELVEVLERATVRADPVQRQRKIIELRAKVAREDTAFAQFLTSVIETPRSRNTAPRSRRA